MNNSAARTNSSWRRRRFDCAGLVLALVSSLSSGNPRATDACAPDALRQPYAPRSFLGYACEEPDCALHKAGFAWADRMGVTDPLDCAVAGLAGFEQGCRAFAEETVTAEQAGFEWARENEVADGCLCRGAGPRFEAGCDAYVAGFGGRAPER
jgi:hypothetical protein